MSWLDWILLVPALPFLATWWLPWEQWVESGRIRPWFAGPYLLYLAFLCLHFDRAWWALVGYGVAGLAVIGRELERKNRAKLPPD